VLIRSLIASALFLGAQASIPAIAYAQDIKSKPKSASNEEILTYVNISIATFCEARGQEVDFKKSMAIAVAAQGYPVYSKHGGLVPGSTKPLEEKQFIGNASFMVMAGSLKICPQMVPAAEKAKFEKALAAAQKK
tara:strand:- start:77 stop:481 length:405 start_codon:yes stop_codon:yes gene_type:complete